MEGISLPHGRLKTLAALVTLRPKTCNWAYYCVTEQLAVQDIAQCDMRNVECGRKMSLLDLFPKGNSAIQK